MLNYSSSSGGSSTGFGSNWMTRGFERLTFSGGNVIYRQSPVSTKIFVPGAIPGTFQATFFIRDVLTLSGGVYTLTDPAGGRKTFDATGKLTSFAGPGGVVATVTYSGNDVASIGAVSGAESWKYEYTWSAGNVSSILYKVNSRSVLKSDYDYASGKLKTIKTYENSTAGTGTPVWGSVPVEATRYSYHTASGLLRHVVPPAEYRQMANNGLHPDTADDSVLNEYAETEYAYHPDGRVSTMYTHGRRFQYGFTYTSKAQTGSSFNVWRMKTEVSRPGEVVETIYLNSVGEVILKRMEQKSGAAVLETWYPVYQKFEEVSARIALSADASVIGTVSEADPNLVTLKITGGKIEEYFYNGDGQLDYVQIRNGTSGIPSRIRTLTYTSKTEGSLGTVRPIASETVYREEGNNGPITTNYTYTWHANTLQPSKITTTLPAVPASQNGTGIATPLERHLDVQGYLTKQVDGTGTATAYEYDKLRNARVAMIQDQGTGRLNLRTDYLLDDRGRRIRELGPQHSIDLGGTATDIRRGRWTYYKTEAGEIWSFGGYRKVSDSTDQAVGAVTIARTNLVPPPGLPGWRQDETYGVDFTGSGIPTGSETFPRSQWVNWKISLINKSSELKEEWTYWAIPSSGYGTLDVDYGRKLTAYDAAGRQNETTCAGGTTDRTTFNAMGWPVLEELGTSSGLTVTQSNRYDANGNLIKVTLPVDGTPANDRVTDYHYDWRNRQTGTDTKVEKDGGGEWLLLTRMTYDNRDLVLSKTNYHTAEATGNRTAFQTTAYDVLTRNYRTQTYAVAANGTASSPQIDDLHYDANSQVIKDAPSGSKLYTATEFDAVGRIAKIFRAYGGTSPSSSSSSQSESSSSQSESSSSQSESSSSFSLSSWSPSPSSPSSSSSSTAPPLMRQFAAISGDTVMEQLENTYDAAGNLISVITRQRYDDATGTGPLQDPSNQPKARVSYSANYPDALGLTQAATNYGTNNGSAWTRPGTVPARTGLVPQPEVTSFRYNAVGAITRETDPAGIRNCHTWDQAGRLTALVENCPESSSSSSSSSSSGAGSVDVRTTRYEYTPDGWLKKLVSDNAATGQQVTEWIYGVGPAQGSALYSKRLVYQKVFPDATGTANRITYTYNRQLETTGQSDQLGTIHVLTRDKLGRLLADTATAFGSGVDTTVGKLETGYNERGLAVRASSYNTSGSTKLNEIAWEYNGFNQPIFEYQEHSGVINPATSLKVGYTYADGSANTTRPTGIKYPHVGSGSAVTIESAYTSPMANALSRVDELKESGTILSSWRYVGLATVVAQKYNAAANTELTYGTSANAYSGYDRFGRIAGTLWKSGANVLVESKYGRNAVGGIEWRKDVKAHALSVTSQDDFYWYDGLRQVKQHDRGDLTPSGGPPYTGIVPATRQQQEIFGYDETGNWLGYHSQTPALSQSRAHNTANQITAIAAPSGVVQPVYDPAGNMRTMPAPADWNTSYTCKWDAWNRLVEIKNGSTVVSAFVYDALTRRTKRLSNEGTRYYLYDRQWRALEERISGFISRQFTWNPNDRWNLIRSKRTATAILDEVRYVLRDNLDPVAIIDESATVDERYGYDAFGKHRFMDAGFGTRGGSICDWIWLFHGEFLDTGNGLYNYGYRYYHPQLGRWISRDPIGESGGLNLYGFVKNDGVNRWDRLGMKPCSEYTKTRTSATGKKEGRTKDDAGHPKTANGCDSSPDSFFGVVDFTSACNTHDICYQTCGADREDCDRAIREDMESACHNAVDSGDMSIIWLSPCLTQAHAYELTLTAVAGSGFEASQDYHCKWECCEE